MLINSYYSHSMFSHLYIILYKAIKTSLTAASFPHFSNNLNLIYISFNVSFLRNFEIKHI